MAPWVIKIAYWDMLFWGFVQYFPLKAFSLFVVVCYFMPINPPLLQIFILTVKMLINNFVYPLGFYSFLKVSNDNSHLLSSKNHNRTHGLKLKAWKSEGLSLITAEQCPCSHHLESDKFHYWMKYKNVKHYLKELALPQRKIKRSTQVQITPNLEKLRNAVRK